MPSTTTGLSRIYLDMAKLREGDGLSPNMYVSAFIGVVGEDHRALITYDTFMYAGLVVFRLYVMKLLLSFDGAIRSSSTYVSNIPPVVSGSQLPSRRNHLPV